MSARGRARLLAVALALVCAGTPSTALCAQRPGAQAPVQAREQEQSSPLALLVGRLSVRPRVLVVVRRPQELRQRLIDSSVALVAERMGLLQSLRSGWDELAHALERTSPQLREDLLSGGLAMVELRGAPGADGRAPGRDTRAAVMLVDQETAERLQARLDAVPDRVVANQPVLSIERGGRLMIVRPAPVADGARAFAAIITLSEAQPEDLEPLAAMLGPQEPGGGTDVLSAHDGWREAARGAPADITAMLTDDVTGRWTVARAMVFAPGDERAWTFELASTSQELQGALGARRALRDAGLADRLIDAGAALVVHDGGPLHVGIDARARTLRMDAREAEGDAPSQDEGVLAIAPPPGDTPDGEQAPHFRVLMALRQSALQRASGPGLDELAAALLRSAGDRRAVDAGVLALLDQAAPRGTTCKLPPGTTAFPLLGHVAQVAWQVVPDARGEGEWMVFAGLPLGGGALPVRAAQEPGEALAWARAWLPREQDAGAPVGVRARAGYLLRARARPGMVVRGLPGPLALVLGDLLMLKRAELDVWQPEGAGAGADGDGATPVRARVRLEWEKPV